jgi:hypothetical protein
MNIYNKYDINLLCDQLTELAKIASFHKHAKQAEEVIIAELFPDKVHAKRVLKKHWSQLKPPTKPPTKET